MYDLYVHQGSWILSVQFIVTALKLHESTLCQIRSHCQVNEPIVLPPQKGTWLSQSKVCNLRSLPQTLSDWLVG